MTSYLCITPGSSIAAASTSAGPTAAGSTVVIYRLDEGGNITSLGSGTIYNVDTTQSVPSGVLAELRRSPGGRFYAHKWFGQASGSTSELIWPAELGF